ncbi:Xaa-Pro aminopeptidase [hydrothermal vent metagenome]|uniref:Xaa-Pro aminopeptidase n=1 Tax=hydrothermal vent metagenome TaxID=652676 RepID=A0A3B0ZGC5_9ZZZZ
MMINAREFPKRRKELMRMMGRETIAILPTAKEKVRNRDAEYPFRADSDFYYLTGFPEPEALMVLLPGREKGEFILFCRERDAEKETWHGRRAGIEGACEIYGADDAFPIEDLGDILPGLIESCDRVFYTFGNDSESDQKITGMVHTLRAQARSGKHTPHEFVALEHLLHDMRLYKSRSELKVMREAAHISAAAHVKAMQACKPGVMEYQLEAEFLYAFRRANGHPAYSTIVGGGDNGCILHYTENGSVLVDGDLVLIDAGAEIDNYAADITRTFPVNGRFSEAQRALYQVVLDAQYAAIEQVQPGNHWNDPHQATVKVLTEGLLALGLLKGTLAELIEEQAYRRFYMHRTGHWLGLDVHDVGDYKVGDEWRVLEPGMVLTIEPGLYIGAEKDIPKRFRNMGIRIEDDVVVTKEGHEVMTDGVPKEIAAIEQLMAG